MSNIIPPPELIPVVNEQRLITTELADFFTLVADLAIATGSGSPEGVLSARVEKQYMDTAAGTGSILYIKRDTDIAGDTTKGWILV